MSISLALLLSTNARAQSVSVPIPDFHVSDQSCLVGTGGLIPCVELYAYQVDLTDMLVGATLDSFHVTPGLTWWGVDGDATVSVNDAADPFRVHVYTSVGGILGINQTCDGWVDPFVAHGEADAHVAYHPLAGMWEVDVPPLVADLSDLDDTDIHLTGPGLSCTVDVIDTALSAIPVLDLGIYDFILDAVIPPIEDGIAGLNVPVENALNNYLN